MFEEAEPTYIICRASPPSVCLCIACSRVRVGLGDQTVLESSGNGQQEQALVGYSFFCIDNSHSLLDLQWSKTHGFYIIMGGFHLFERDSKETYDSMSREQDTPVHPLAARSLSKEDTTIDVDFSSFTVPTEAEIKDKGKGDWLAKSLVLLQTSWFVMQCIALAIKHLPITHLEILTLAYPAMNFVTYIFWWNKPLNVNRPVRVFQKLEPRERQPRVRGPISEVRELTWDAIRKGLSTILDFIAGGQDNNVDLSRKDRVPRFWANSTDHVFIITADLIVLGVGVCFGAIHCIAWLFPFPTQTELLIWRISSVAITALPIYIPLTILLAVWLYDMDFVASALTPFLFLASFLEAFCML